MLRGLLPFLLLASLAGCSNNDNDNDGGTADMAVQLDDGGKPLDLTIVSGDMVCVNQVFAGFFGVTTNERRLDCTCGCTVDPFTGAVVAGYWNSAVPGAMFSPSASGLGFTVASDGGIAVAALNTLNPAAPFFIDGDFDLLVDYRISGTPPNGSHIILNTLNDQLPGSSGTYRVERERSSGGTDQYSAELGGIAPVKLATTASQGTLRMERIGFTFRASGDGNQVTQFLGGAKARLYIVLTAALDAGCTGPACTLSVAWKNLRLAKGALVDRR